MSVVPLVFKSFEGGWGTDLKTGIKNSFAYSQSVDFRKSPSQFTVLPGTRREDNGVVNDLVQNEVMTKNGSIYAIGSNGSIYKRTTSGVWSNEANLGGVGTFGIDYRQDSDSIYIPSPTTVGLYQNLTTTPSFIPNNYGSSASTYDNSANAGFNVDTAQSGSAFTYTLPAGIQESPPNERFFQSDIEPLQKISVFIPAAGKGTGDWTLTLHDGLNTNLGSVTVTNANLVDGVFNDFVFSSPVRIYVVPNARTYHVHLTSTVADGKVSCSTANNLSTCDLQVWANRLIQTTNGLHPMIRFQQYECFGNANYLSIWEPISTIPTNAEWQRHKLVFPSEYEVCGLAVFNEYLAIACEKVSSTSTTTPQEGIIFFWDGVSNTYNYLTKIPEGSPYALHEYKNVIYYYAGGAWYAISSPTTQPTKVRTMPGTDTEFSGSAAPIVVYPYAATVRRGVHLMAFPSTTTNTNINYGVYSWGSVDKNFPDSFGYSYLLSTGSQNYSVSNNLTIGMVQNFGDTLHVSWRDTLNGGYGVDVVDNTSTPATFATWQSLIFDNGYPAKRKKGIYLQATFLTLPSDASFVLKYKLDRAANWTSSAALTPTIVSNTWNGANYARFDIDQPSYFYEIQAAVDITSGTTTPTFTSVVVVFDDNKQETLN